MSPSWKQATEAALAELMARDLSTLDVAEVTVGVGGIEVAGQCCVAAPVIPATAPRCPSGCGWATPRTRPW